MNSPTKLKINPQTVQSRKRSGCFSDSDNDGSSEKNLVRLDKHDLTSKFTSEATIPENIVTTLDRKLSGNNTVVLTDLNRCDRILASADSNSYINTNTTTIKCASMPVNMGNGTGRTSRNLCPRQHMDKLSNNIYYGN